MNLSNLRKKVETYNIYIFLFILVCAGFFGIRSLLHPGFYTSHDGEHQILREIYFDDAIKDGQYPPRWAQGNILNGYGYPLFIFSYHAPWFFGEPFMLLGRSATESVKSVFIVTYILSAIVMFLWIRTIWGNRAGFISALVYIVAPYRFEVILVRGALGEATSFLFVPLVFWSITEIIKNKKTRFISIGAIGLAGLILSHAMIVYMFLLPIFFFVTVEFFLKKLNKTIVISTISMVLLGVGLASYYLLPAMLEKNLTQFDSALQLHYKDYFVAFWQLLYSKWGYGFDFPGTQNDAMSFQVGITQWLLVLFALISIAIFIVKRKTTAIIKKNVFYAGTFLVIYIFSIIMMLSISTDIWNVAVKLFAIDFPWRFLAIATFSSAVLAGFVTYIFPYKKLFICGIILLLFVNNRNYMRVNQYTYMSDTEYRKITNTTNQFDEYLPKWANQRIYSSMKYTEIVSDAKTSIRISKNTSNNLIANLISSGNAHIRINRIYYPGWKLIVDGEKKDFEYESTGLPQFTLGKGNHALSYHFSDTPWRLFANSVSIFACIITLSLFVVSKRKKEN